MLSGGVLKIDASGKSFGRVCSLVASTLLGKFNDDIRNLNSVVITNPDKVVFTNQKDSKTYRHRYSGFVGGLHSTIWSTLRDKSGHKGLFLPGIKGMLPKNKTSELLIKKVKFEELNQ